VDEYSGDHGQDSVESHGSRGDADSGIRNHVSHTHSMEPNSGIGMYDEADMDILAAPCHGKPCVATTDASVPSAPATLTVEGVTPFFYFKALPLGAVAGGGGGLAYPQMTPPPTTDASVPSAPATLTVEGFTPFFYFKVLPVDAVAGGGGGLAYPQMTPPPTPATAEVTPTTQDLLASDAPSTSDATDADEDSSVGSPPPITPEAPRGSPQVSSSPVSYFNLGPSAFTSSMTAEEFNRPYIEARAKFDEEALALTRATAKSNANPRSAATLFLKKHQRKHHSLWKTIARHFTGREECLRRRRSMWTAFLDDLTRSASTGPGWQDRMDAKWNAIRANTLYEMDLGSEGMELPVHANQIAQPSSSHAQSAPESPCPDVSVTIARSATPEMIPKTAPSAEDVLETATSLFLECDRILRSGPHKVVYEESINNVIEQMDNASISLGGAMRLLDNINKHMRGILSDLATSLHGAVVPTGPVGDADAQDEIVDALMSPPSPPSSSASSGASTAEPAVVSQSVEEGDGPVQAPVQAQAGEAATTAPAVAMTAMEVYQQFIAPAMAERRAEPALQAICLLLEHSMSPYLLGGHVPILEAHYFTVLAELRFHLNRLGIMRDGVAVPTGPVGAPAPAGAAL
jgi:hypothetical protein